MFYVTMLVDGPFGGNVLTMSGLLDPPKQLIVGDARAQDLLPDAKIPVSVYHLEGVDDLVTRGKQAAYSFLNERVSAVSLVTMWAPLTNDMGEWMSAETFNQEEE